jgi:hypothetical protein
MYLVGLTGASFFPDGAQDPGEVSHRGLDRHRR